MKLLIIEDEIDLRQTLAAYLVREGFVCEQAADISSASEKLAVYEYDAIILDIGLPDGNGLKLLDTLKNENPEMGVIIISARDSLDDKLSGLDQGADDYLTKPFHLAELNSRINSVIRRRHFQGHRLLEYHDIEIDTQARQVRIRGKDIGLTRTEYFLLLFLFTNKNRVLTKESIAEHIWGDHIDQADSFDFVYTHIKNLRKKIISAGGIDYLKTVYGMGYKFTDR